MTYTCKISKSTDSTKNEIIMLLSGGFDSLALLDKLMRAQVANIKPVYVKASFLFNKADRELEAVKKTLDDWRDKMENYSQPVTYTIKSLAVVKLDIPHKGNQIDIMAPTWPFALAMVFDPDKHYAIALADNYNDLGNHNLDAINRLILDTIQVSHGIAPMDLPILMYPFINKYKREVLNETNPHSLIHAWTCESRDIYLDEEGNLPPCRVCKKCLEVEPLRHIFDGDAVPTHFKSDTK